MASKKPTLPLKEIPDDVKEYLLKVQGETKVRKKTAHYSLCQTVYQIIRDHKSLLEKLTTE